MSALPPLSTNDIATIAENEIKLLKSFVRDVRVVSAYIPNIDLLQRLEGIERSTARIRGLVQYIDANLPERA